MAGQGATDSDTPAVGMRWGGPLSDTHFCKPDSVEVSAFIAGPFPLNQALCVCVVPAFGSVFVCVCVCLRVFVCICVCMACEGVRGKCFARHLES